MYSKLPEFEASASRLGELPRTTPAVLALPGLVARPAQGEGVAALLASFLTTFPRPIPST